MVILAAAALVACGGQEGDRAVSSKDVMNPVSADGVDAGTRMPAVEVVSRDGKDGKIFDFGIVIQGENVAHTFEIKNTGNADLVISGAAASCGCTVPKYSKKPIAPGQIGKIDVAFASSGREGKQIKTVTLTTNAQPSNVTLTIISNVIVPK